MAELNQIFISVYKKHYSALCNWVVYFVHSTHEAEDIVQESIMALFQKPRVWKNLDEEALKAYFYKCVRNKAIDGLRKQKKMRFVKQPMEQGEFSEDKINDAEIELVKRRAIAELPDKCREVFVLKRKFAMTNVEIALVIERDVKTVEKRMTKALKMLMENKSIKEILGKK